MAITEFQGKYRFLSNFWIEPDGSSVECEYQAAKCKNSDDAQKILSLTPYQAKRYVRTVPTTTYNERTLLSTMERLVTQKFKDHPSLALQLLATGDEELIEGNWWGDRFWGMCNGTGLNILGKILMSVRKDLVNTKTE